jgi:hypothetical protein
MRNIKLNEADGKKLREQYPNSFFLDEYYDKAIVGVNKNGAIRYHLTELVYINMDDRREEFKGEDYEQAKDEFTDEFQDFYDMSNEQVLLAFSENETQCKYGSGKKLVPAVLTIKEPKSTDN